MAAHFGGFPLHFLAQIDCAGIAFRTVLPDRGVLFFFGRDDDEQIWDMYEPADSCRVLYALDVDATTPRRNGPDDLPPIGGYYAREAAREFLLVGESGPSVHVEWPIQPLPIDTWPDVLFGDYGSRAGAQEWLRRSNESDLDEPVSEEDRREWLVDRETSYAQSPIGSSTAELVFLSMIATIRAWAGDPIRAARIAPQVYQIAHFHFGGITDWA